MSRTLLGCIADDYTGATDLSSMLVRAGLKVVQLFGSDSFARVAVPEIQRQIMAADALVVALKSRSIPAFDAVQASLKSLRWLQSLGAERFFFKYCSTFDSTAKGNIGPVAQALASELQVSELWHCPSFPENGRTVYCGHLFVEGVLLHESGMKDHPLNPMTDSHLVRVLQTQCKKPVGLITLQQLHRDFEPHACSASAYYWIVDAIFVADLQRIAKLASQHRFLAGGSAIAGQWAGALSHAGEQKPRAMESDVATNAQASMLPADSLTVILAGSCSSATRRQIEFFALSHPLHDLPIAQIASGRLTAEAVIEQAVEWCLAQSGHRSVLVTSSRLAEEVSKATQILGGQAAARRTESVFASIAERLAFSGVRCFVVAGGETAGAVINSLGVDAVQIGRELAPGVPCVRTLRSPPLSLVLKSGNFGSPSFFDDAIEAMS